MKTGYHATSDSQRAQLDRLTPIGSHKRITLSPPFALLILWSLCSHCLTSYFSHPFLHRLCALLVLHRCEHQLDFTEIRDSVAQNNRKVVLEVELNRRAEAGTLREEDQVLELEDALDDFIRSSTRLVDLHVAAVLANHRLLFRKVAHTTENEVRRRRCNLHVQLLPQRIHVAANLLEVRGRHVDDAREIQRRNLDVLHIRVKELQEIVRGCGLLGILHADAKLVRIGCRQIQRQAIAIPHCLDELEKVNHIHAENMLRRAIVILKAV